MAEVMLVDSITSNARQDPGKGALQVMNHASGSGAIPFHCRQSDSNLGLARWRHD
jgi:hypothetical protein